MRKMRLSDFEIDAIKQTARDVFGPEVEAFLFGSRLHDDKKGGEIDYNQNKNK